MSKSGRIAPECGCETTSQIVRGLCRKHYNQISRKPATREQNLKRHGMAALRKGSALKPPTSMPYRVLARTCLKCGHLITTPDPMLRKSVRGIIKCPCCRGGVKTPTQVSIVRANSLTRQTQRQLSTVDSAGNSRKEWTGPELEMLARDDLTLDEIATMLGRTFFAARRMRTNMHLDPRKDRLAGISGTPKVVTPALRDPGVANPRG